MASKRALRELERPVGRPVEGGIRWRSPLEAMGRGVGVGVEGLLVEPTSDDKAV
jgi:hypothetical protein